MYEKYFLNMDETSSLLFCNSDATCWFFFLHFLIPLLDPGSEQSLIHDVS